MTEPAIDPRIPAGMRQSPASGLIVPEAQSRVVETWTKAERRLYNDFMAAMVKRNIDVYLGCPLPTCKRVPIQRLATTDGFLLRCAHVDRRFSQGKRVTPGA